MKSIKLLISILFALVSTSVFAAPRLTMYEDAFNFGYIPQQAAVSHDFWLFSTGDAPLLVLQVVPGCSCTQMPIEKKNIPVGDSSRLEIVFHSRTSSRAASKHPKITTNAESAPKTLEIISYIITNPDSTYPIKIEPWPIKLNGTPETPNMEATFTVTNLSGSSLSTEMIAVPASFLDVILPATIPAKGTAKGSIRVKEALAKKVIEKSITFELNDVAKSRYTIPVSRTYKSAETMSLTNDTLKNESGTTGK